MGAHWNRGTKVAEEEDRRGVILYLSPWYNRYLDMYNKKTVDFFPNVSQSVLIGRCISNILLSISYCRHFKRALLLKSHTWSFDAWQWQAPPQSLLLSLQDGRSLSIKKHQNTFRWLKIYMNASTCLFVPALHFPFLPSTCLFLFSHIFILLLYCFSPDTHQHFVYPGEIRIMR